MKKSAILALAVSTLMTVGCKGNPATKGKTVLHFIGVQDTFTQTAMNELISLYNEGQGEKDKIYVNPTWSNGDYGQYPSTLARNSRYSVVTVEVGQFKQLAVNDYFVQLDTDEYLTEENKQMMDYDNISDVLLNPFRFNGKNKNADGKYEAGKGQPLRGIPFGTSPFVLYYNSKIFKNAGINIISIPETELDEYNLRLGTNIKPHGYAEYKNKPFEGAISSTNLEGKTVYKVFNDDIAMNWEENRILSYSFQKQFGYEFGYMSEWWFNYGFSVGGDCIGWNDSKHNYEFTVTNKASNWLAIKDLTIGSNQYKKGQVLYHEDAVKVNSGSVSKDDLYEMPSQYDAFLEANRLAVPKNKNIETGISGYGISPYTTTNRNARFLTGNDCPLLVESYSSANSFKSSLKNDFDIAISPQYREYENGSVHGNTNSIDGQYLNVIGEEYNDVVYTGDLKVEKGTPIVGEVQNTGKSYALCIPKNSDKKKYNAAMKFISWVCSKEGQSKIASSNSFVPTNKSLALSKDYYGSSDRVVTNTYAASLASINQDIGDYNYFQTKTWIDSWASLLNVNVRNGSCTLAEFEAQKTEEANVALASMTLRVYGR